MMAEKSESRNTYSLSDLIKDKDMPQLSSETYRPPNGMCVSNPHDYIQSEEGGGGGGGGGGSSTSRRQSGELKIPNMNSDNYSLSNFIEDMPQLTFNTKRSRDDMLVFWNKDDYIQSEEEEGGYMVKDLIKSALEDVKSGSSTYYPNILIQFWAVKTTIGGGRFLTTTNQPFSLRRIERGGLCDYRIHCMTLEFNVVDDDDDGVIGRVFKHKHLESTPNVGYYSTKDYPQREIALKWGVRRSLAVPVFRPSDWTCYGVLELVDTARIDGDPNVLYSATKDIFKEKCLETYLPLELQIDEGTNKVLDEINKALQVICTTHQLPLAQIWIPCYRSYLGCTNTYSFICQSNDDDVLLRFNGICGYHYLTEGQGIVGKALLSHKPCFCRDVSQLPIAEYPLSHYALEYRFSGCFAICLHTTSGTKNDDYVLEFFLPLLWNIISGDPQTFLNSLLATVKKHLSGFKICSGERLVEELRIEVEEAEKNNDYTPSQFLKDMSQLTTFNTNWTRKGTWVFWSEDDQEHYPHTEEGCTVKDLIISALHNVTPVLLFANVLIQFWAVKTRIGGGGRFLTTRNQPFALRRIERGGLCDYRIHCMTLEFNVVDDDDDGVIGRVFKHKHLESTPNVGYYSTKDYPQREIALKCGVRRSLAVPVFRPSDKTCYGVLELVDTTEYYDGYFPYNLYSATKYILEGKCLETYLPLELQIEEATNKVLHEINEALEVVCTTHQLPLAQIWIPSSAMAYVDSSKKSYYNSYLYCTDSCSSLYQSQYEFLDDDEMLMFNCVCRYHYLRKGQGTVGKALLSHKPCFCRDVSQLPMSEYPLSHYARKYELTGCFAICLHNTCIKYHDYVLEFFLPIISGDPQTTLESLLETVKKHLPGFEICSEGPVEVLRVEVLNISINDEQDSFNLCQATGIQPIPESLQNEREAVRYEVIGEVVIDNGLNVFGVGQNGVAVTCLDKITETSERENEIAKTPINDEIEVVQLSDEDLSVETTINNESTVMVAEKDYRGASSLEEICKGETLEREHGATEVPLSRDNIRKQFGKTPDDASKILEVSRSTLKRECREHGIDKWPSSKRTKVKPSSSSMKHANEVVQGSNERVPDIAGSSTSRRRMGELKINSTMMIEEVENNNNYTLSQFIKDMPRLTYWSHDDGRVFWSKDDYIQSEEEEEEEEEWCTVKDLIKSALYNVKSGTYDDHGHNILIQFWALKTIGRRRFLTTRNQPFGLRRIERGLCEYRKYCMSLEFNVNDDDGFGGGVIGRVFKHKHLESTPNVGYYSTKDYAQREFALKFGIRRSLVVSLFEPSDRYYYGVLELVDTHKDDTVSFNLYSAAEDIFKEGYLKTHLLLELQIEEGTYEVLREMKKVLQVVCTTHQLPLAQIWIPCRHRSAVAYVDSSEKSCYSSYLGCTDTYSFICQSDDVLEPFRFNRICSYHYLRKDQGIVGKALLSHKPCFCRDVSQLPIAEYPLSHYAREYGLSGCFAICLHSTHAKNDDYVLEFFLPPLWNIISGDPQTFLESLLATVKKHLPGFEICSGEGPVEELRVEVLKISMNDEQDSSNLCRATRIQPIPESLQNEREAMQNKVTSEAVIDNVSIIFGAEQNGVALGCLDKRVEMSDEERENEVGEELFVEVAKTATDDEITTILPPMPGTLQNEIEVVQLSDEDSSAETVVQNQLNVVVAKQDDRGASSLEEICRGETLEREHGTTEVPLSRDNIRKQFGKTLDDASKIFGVSRSTLKRECRKHGIPKWPFPKRKKANPSSSGMKHVNEVVQGSNERVPDIGKRDPSCSDPPPMNATAAVAHTITNVTPKQDVRTVTIKATYGDEIIRFQLPFASRKVDLVEKVTRRLPLKDGTFNIKYQDDDGDWVLIACDEDLEECIGISKGKSEDTSIIKLLVHPITNQAP